MNTPLTKQKCVPCEGGVAPLKRGEFQQYLDAVVGWTVLNNDTAIQKKYTFKNFKHALDFVNRVGEIAENEGHHPDINLHAWKHVTITLSTHAIGGLSVNDFIVAAKTDQLTSNT